MASIVSGLIAILFYVVSSGLALRQLRDNKPPKRVRFLTLGWLAVGCHVWSLWHIMVQPEGVSLGLFTIASAIALVGTLLVLISSFYRPLEWLSLMVFPASAILLVPALFLNNNYVSQPLTYGLAAHVVLSILAYAVLTIACFQSIWVIVQHKQLKKGLVKGPINRLSPIQTTESILFELIWSGFILLAAAIVIGFFYVYDLREQHLAHQVILTIASWLIFALLLTGRHFWGWRAVTAVKLTLIGYGVLLVAFFGTEVIVDIIHNRPF